MRNNLLIIIFIITVTTLFSEESKDPEIIVRELINELNTVVDESENQTLKKTLSLPMEKFKNNELHFQIQEKIEGYEDSYLGQAVFTFFIEDKTKPQVITIEEKLLRFYPENRSLIMAVIMHEMSHANDFYINPDYMRSITKNKLEKYLYEMDAMFIESQFIEIAQLKGYSLTDFEHFMVNSMIDDNLAVASLILHENDNSLIWKLINKKDDYLNEEISIDVLFSDLIFIGDSLMEKWNSDFKDADISWGKLVKMIQMKTYQEFMSNIINDIITEEFLDSKKNEIEYINELINTLFENVSEQWDSTKDYRNQLNDYVMLGKSLDS